MTSRLFAKIRQAVAEEQYVIGQHANERLRRRCIPAWQVLSGLVNGKMIRERARAKPNPVVEVQQELADGTRIKTVWAWLGQSRIAKLVTMHFFDA